MRRGTLFLPRRFYGAFDEGSIQATDESSGEELDVSFTPPRQLDGLRPFFQAHELKPNDAVKLRLEEGALVLGVVVRERRSQPDGARTSADESSYGQAPQGQSAQDQALQGHSLHGQSLHSEARQDTAPDAHAHSQGVTGADRHEREGAWGRDREPEQLGIVRERRISAQERAPQEQAAQSRAAQSQAEQDRAAEMQAAETQAAQERERAAQAQAAEEREVRQREAHERELQQRKAKELEAQQREAREREARQQAAQQREQQERAAKEANASERAANERVVDAELTAPPTSGWQKVLHDPAPRRTQGVPVSPEELGKVDDTTEIWKRSRSRSATGGAIDQSASVRNDEVQSRSKGAEAAPSSAQNEQGGLSPLDAGGAEAWHLSPRDLSRANATPEKPSEDDGLWVKETRRPKAAPTKPLAPEPNPESQPGSQPGLRSELRSEARSEPRSERGPEPLLPASGRKQVGLFDSTAQSEAEVGEEREKVAVGASAGSESNAASRVTNYLRDPGTPAIVRAPAIAETLGLPLGDVQRALEDVSRSSEGSVTPIRADVYLVKRNRQEE